MWLSIANYHVDMVIAKFHLQWGFWGGVASPNDSLWWFEVRQSRHLKPPEKKSVRGALQPSRSPMLRPP